MLNKYFVYVAYNGTNYHGWQRQKNAISVQEVLEQTFEIVYQNKTAVYGSGRTDAGVHASGQVAHLELEHEFDMGLLRKLNGILPKDISILDVRKVQDDSHARFDATSRKYVYKFHTYKSPFHQELSSYYPFFDYSIDELNELSKLFVGKKDFQAFSRVKTEVNNFVCDITEAHWVMNGEQFEFHIRANRFLRGMVRAIVGTQLDILKDKLKTKSIPEILASRDRKMAGQAAHPQGLFLTEVVYPESVFEIEKKVTVE